MASGSKVSFNIHYPDVPLLDQTEQFAKDNIFPGGSWTNHKWLEKKVSYDKHLALHEQAILCDAITSGGLLISMPKQEATDYINKLGNQELLQAGIIGEVIEKRAKTIYVTT